MQAISIEVEENQEGYEVPKECNSLEVSCLTDSGVYLPAAVINLETGIDRSLYVEPLRFRARFLSLDYSKVRYSDQSSDVQGTFASDK